MRSQLSVWCVFHVLIIGRPRTFASDAIYGVCSLSTYYLIFIDLKLESSRIDSIALTFNDPTRYIYDSRRMFLNTSNHSSPHAAELPTIWQIENKEFSLRERERERFVRLKMGSEGAEIKGLRKLRLLCLHGFRTSGEIIKKQVTGKWPESVLEKLDLVFVDAPFPCQGKSDVEGIFDPPYYEWFQFNKVRFLWSFYLFYISKSVIVI